LRDDAAACQPLAGDDGVAHRPGVMFQSSPTPSDGGWLAV
jgi:hypothetical protein